MTWCVAIMVAASTGCTGTTLSYEPRDPDASAARRLASPQFHPSELQSVAIIVRNESDKAVSSGVLRRIDDEFTYALIQKGYALASRSDIESVLPEIRLQQSSVTEQGAARIGRMLNASAVLVVNVTSSTVLARQVEYRRSKSKAMYYETEFSALGSISVRLIGVERADFCGLQTTSVKAPQQREEILSYIATEVARAFPTRPSSAPPRTQPIP
jgi:hypothetical protein